jgi:hypothetical protein
VFSKDEVQKTTAELRNSIRSIEWDLEDLEDTIGKYCFSSLFILKYIVAVFT